MRRTVAKDADLAELTLLEEPDFVRDRIWPLLSRVSDAPLPDGGPTIMVHRHRDDGRVVAEYRFEGSTSVFAKLYPRSEAGRAAKRIYEGLYRRGFGADSPYRVPEPIAYLDPERVLLLRGAAGTRITESETHDSLARVAGWLVELHASPLGLGPRESVADGVLRLARRAAKATSCRPELEPLVRSSLAELARRCPSAPETEERVQTHGRFHLGHVFVARECVTAIDLDRVAQADPAKDVGEFVHRLRSIAAKAGAVDVAVENACRRFLDEYVRRRGAAPAELVYYWSYGVLWTLFGLTFKDRPARPGWSDRIDFFRREFDAVPKLAADWLR